jgi:ribulose-phosphate 3-epimerase
LLPEIDMVLLMTIEPGFGGQEFMTYLLPKIRNARELISAHGAEIWLQVDGGVGEETIERCAEAGADMFVAGSAVFGAEDPAESVSMLRQLAVKGAAAAADGPIGDHG